MCTRWGLGRGGRSYNDIAAPNGTDLSYGMHDKCGCNWFRLCVALLLLGGCPDSDSPSTSGDRHDHRGISLEEACESACAASDALHCSEDLPRGECERACNYQRMSQTKACEHQAWIDVNDCMSKSTLFCDQTQHAAVKVEDCGQEIEALGDCFRSDQDVVAGGNGAAGREGAYVAAGRGGAGGGGAGGGGGGTGGGAEMHAAGSGGGAADQSWFCSMVEAACVCIPAQSGSATATCAPPDPGCCVEALSNGEVTSCQCWPEGSGVCTLPASSPSGYRSIDTCPSK